MRRAPFLHEVGPAGHGDADGHGGEQQHDQDETDQDTATTQCIPLQHSRADTVPGAT